MTMTEQNPHEAHPARELGPKYVQFHTKSYSTMFECPCCGLRRRYNLNYLGQRKVPMCDGVKMTVTDRLSFSEWTAAKNKAIAAAIERGREGTARAAQAAA
jgi:hypothetical protein